MTVRADGAAPACSPLLLSMRALALLVASEERAGLWTDAHLHFPCPYLILYGGKPTPGKH